MVCIQRKNKLKGRSEKLDDLAREFKGEEKRKEKTKKMISGINLSVGHTRASIHDEDTKHFPTPPYNLVFRL